MVKQEIEHKNQKYKYKLLFQENGAVTVFSVIVLSALLLFFSFLIDYARIAALHKLTEDAVRSSVRSVLSAYDATLYERYGLFGRGGTDGKSIFTATLAANTEGDSHPNSARSGMKLVRSKLEASELHTASFLGNHDVFARQVLEEMKYKAPIDFTLELAEKFIPMASPMKEASITVNLLEKMKKLYEKREVHLAKVLQLQKQMATTLSGSTISTLIPMQNEWSAVDGNTAFSIAGEYSDYAAKVMHNQSLAEDENPSHLAEIEAYENKITAFSMELRKLSDVTQKQHVKQHMDAIKELELARALNEDMKRLTQQAEQQPSNQGYNSVSRHNAIGGEQNSVPANAASDLEQIRKTADELVMTDTWFVQYRQELEVQSSSVAAIDMEAGSFQTSSLASIVKPITSISAETLLEGAASLRLAFGNYEQDYTNPASVITARQKAIEQSDVKSQLKQQEQQVGSLWKQARSMLHGITTLPQSEEHLQVFKQVQQLYKDNLLFNQQTDETADAVEMGQTSDAHEAAEQSSAFMGGLFTGLAGMLEKTRNSVYFGEYVVQRYTSFAPQNLRNMLSGGNLSELSHAVAFNNQEVEYIIYGFHNPIGNIAAAYGELFATRLAIRLMEGLIESKSLSHPLLILSAALIYALKNTIEDMIAFTERGSAPLSKYVQVELFYTDYLRLFIVLHGADDTPSLSRIIATIEQNSGTTLSAIPSGVTGEAKVSMELWFIPGLIRTLGNFGILEGKVVGNRYETTQTIGWSY